MKNLYHLFVALLSFSVGMQFSSCTQQQKCAGVTVAIDPNETEAPTQKYIYGQFIEHHRQSFY